MKLKTLAAGFALLTLTSSSSFAAVQIGSLVTDGTGAGTIQIGHDIVFINLDLDPVPTQSAGFVAITAGFTGEPSAGSYGQIGSALEFGGNVTGSKSYVRSIIGFELGDITTDMVIMDFAGGAIPSLQLADTATVKEGNYSVQYSGTSGQNLNLILTDENLIYTDPGGRAYDVISIVPEPSTYAGFAGFAILCLTVIRRKLK